MAGEFKLTQGELNQRAGEIRSVADTVGQELQNAARRIEALLGDWIGESSDAFRALWTDWQSAASQCHGDLVNIANAMDQMGTSFSDHEQSMTSALNKMRA